MGKGEVEYLIPVAHHLTGAAIPPKDLPRIFECFYQVDKSRARKGGGTRLGLAIAKEIVEAHGGKIGVKSVVGLGTCTIGGRDLSRYIASGKG